jgi:acetyl-CoA synthetase
MLGNIAPPWEVILAAIKLGAVVIPATTLLGSDDVTDRIIRGDVRHVITESAQTPKFGGGAGVARWTPIAVGEPADGWLSYDDAFAAPPRYIPDGVTLASDPLLLLLLYFTPGTTAQPKLVEHTHARAPP